METILYIGLFSIISFLVINFMLSVQEANGRIQRKANIYQSSQFLEQHLDYTFTRTRSINSSKSRFNNDNGLLVLELGDGEHRYSINNGEIFYDTTRITALNTKISKFTIEPIYSKKNVIIATRISITYSSTYDPSINEESNFLYILR